MAKKKIDVDFVESIANNQQFQPVSLEELSNKNLEKKAELESVKNIDSEQKGNDISIHDILKSKPSGKLKAIPVPESIHKKIAQLSGVCDFGISDITSSALLYLLDNHKEEIKKLIKKQMLEEWK